MSWPDGGPWIVAATSTNASWEVATAALGAASRVRVAVLRLLAPGEERDSSGAPPYADLATYLEVRASGADPLRIDDVVGLVRSLARNHGLVLVGSVPGLLVPLGRAGWTLADLAWTLGAPVVVVTDATADSTNHTTLALDALANRDLAGTVIAIGEGNDFAELPVALAGRIPAEAADRPELLRTGAAGWLHPLLHAGRGGTTTARNADTIPPETTPSDMTSVSGTGGTDGDTGEGATLTDPPEAPGSAPRESGRDTKVPATGSGGGVVLPGRTVPRAGPAPMTRVVSGKRVVAGLLAVFVVMVLTVCGIALTQAADPEDGSVLEIVEVGPAPPWATAPARPVPHPVPTTRPARPPARTVCPQYAGKVVPTTPDRRTTARVDAAWLRIERWLADHAPRARASLRPPAPAKRIAALQVRMSVAFPADLVASLRRHDGATHTDGFTLPFLYRPMSLEQIVTDWAGTCSVLADVPADDDWWHPHFVPFASAGDGGCLLVDQRSGGHGRVGEFYPEDGTHFADWPASVAELLEGVARSLETGQPYLGRYRPVGTADGVLDWTIEPPR